MAIYEVECIGEVREVYAVEADSEEQARTNWPSGELLISESISVEPVNVQLSN